jgi:ribosome-dependent ATPase
VEKRGVDTLEEAFIAYLEAAGIEDAPEAAAVTAAARPPPARRFDPRRLGLHAARDDGAAARPDPAELRLGPLLLMLAFGFGISFDVENLKFAAYDQDNSMESRQLVEAFSSSRYFSEQAPIRSAAELDQRLRSGELQLVIEIPLARRDLMAAPGSRSGSTAPCRSGRDDARLRHGLAAQYAQSFAASQAASSHAPTPVTIETRFRYNQAFKSANAMVPA